MEIRATIEFPAEIYRKSSGKDNVLLMQVFKLRYGQYAIAQTVYGELPFVFIVHALSFTEWLLFKITWQTKKANELAVQRLGIERDVS